MKEGMVKEFSDFVKTFPPMPTALSLADRKIRETIRNMPSEKPEDKKRKFDPVPLMVRGGISQTCRFWGCSLETYKPKNNSQEKAVETIREYIQKKKYKGGEGLVLFGIPGTGKTHLLIAIMWECAKAEKTVKYMTAEDFFIHMRNSISLGGELEYLKTIIKPDVLILDDLHCISEEESYQYRQLWWVLDKRYFYKRATLTASNKSIDEFKGVFDERTRRRLCANAVLVK